MAIGVAVGDSPVGPFKDAIGKPLHDGSWDYIDPTGFIDDDGVLICIGEIRISIMQN